MVVKFHPAINERVNSPMFFLIDHTDSNSTTALIPRPPLQYSIPSILIIIVVIFHVYHAPRIQMATDQFNAASLNFWRSFETTLMDRHRFPPPLSLSLTVAFVCTLAISFYFLFFQSPGTGSVRLMAPPEAVMSSLDARSVKKKM